MIGGRVRELRVLRVFTREGRGGNHLGVVTEVEDLDDVTMQAIAREVGYSETVFLDLRASPVAARIFTPGRELPFAGHPLVGAAWLLAADEPDLAAIDCGIGRVGAGRDADGSAWIVAPGGQPVAPARAPAGVDAVRAEVVAMPLPYLVVELPSAADVASYVPPPDATDLYVWSWEVPGSRARARFFAPSFDIPEDPATGSAATALIATFRSRGEPTGAITIHQGEEMGHPSAIEVTWDPTTTTLRGTVAEDPPRTTQA